MPSIKQSADYFQSAVDAGSITPIEAALENPESSLPTPTAPSYPASTNPRLRTPMPPNMVLQPDTTRQFFNPSTPQKRLLPLTGSSSSTIGAIASSTPAAPAALPPSQISSTTITNTTGLNFRGNWNSATQYLINDVVQFEISTYVAIKNNTNVEPDTDATSWTLLSKNLNFTTFVPQPSTIGYVQSASNTFGATGGTQAFSSNNTVGNTILVLCMGNNTGTSNPGSTFTVSDSQSNSYTQVGGTSFSTYSGSGHAYNTAIFIASNIKAGSNTVTMSVSGLGGVGPGTRVVIVEFTGAAGVSPLVGYTLMESTQGTSPTRLLINLATTQANQMVCLWCVNGNASNVSPAGFTSPQTGFMYNTISNSGLGVYTSDNLVNASSVLWGVALTNVAQGISANTYFPFDTVEVNNTQYICIKQATSGILLSNSTYWLPFSQGTFNYNSQLGADAAPSTAGSLDDEFNGSQLDLTRWTWVNQGSASASLSKSHLILSDVLQGSSTILFRIIQQTAPSPPWEVTAGPFQYTGSYGNFNAFGLFVGDGTKLITLIPIFDIGSHEGEYIQVIRWTNITTTSATVAQLTGPAPSSGAAYGSIWAFAKYLKIRDDGTNLTFSISSDGIVFWDIYTEARLAFLASISKVGIFLYPNANATNASGTAVNAFSAYLTVDWFRRTI